MFIEVTSSTGFTQSIAISAIVSFYPTGTPQGTTTGISYLPDEHAATIDSYEAFKFKLKIAQGITK